MKVKVCGVKSIQDSELAWRFGADAIGLLVGREHTSEDFIDEDLAKNIAKSCPPYVTPVLVTHLQNPERIYKLAIDIGVNVIQLHSDCSIEMVRQLKQIFTLEKRNIKLIKSFHADDGVIDKLIYFYDEVDAFIIDTADKLRGKVGGTGIVHDWNITAKIVQTSKLPIILAGGLKPDNVAEAITSVKPYAVDANSGLKNATGFKDIEKTRYFVSNAKLAFNKIQNLISFA